MSGVTPLGMLAAEPLLPGDVGQQSKPHSLAQAAEQFENQFLRSLLKEMRQANSVLTEGNPLTSKQQSLWRDFYDDQLSAGLASSHQVGLAEMIVKQLSPAMASGGSENHAAGRSDQLSPPDHEPDR